MEDDVSYDFIRNKVMTLLEIFTWEPSASSLLKMQNIKTLQTA